MRITRFWVEGFRSIDTLVLDDLPSVCVLYGENGSGKSNVLLALRRLTELVRMVTAPENLLAATTVPTDLPVGGLITADDFCRLRDEKRIVLGLCAAVGSEPPGRKVMLHPGFEVRTVEIEVCVEATFSNYGTASIRALKLNDLDLMTVLGKDGVASPLAEKLEPLKPQAARERVVALLHEMVGTHGFRLIPADRHVGHERRTDHQGRAVDPLAAPEQVLTLLNAGKIKQALVTAYTTSDRGMRGRLERMRTLLSGPPFNRLRFDPVVDAKTGEYRIHETLALPDGTEVDLPLEQTGTGVQQVYLLLAYIMLSGAHAVGLEEPEAHLHARTSGRDLRTLLLRMVDERDLQQIFVTTHSNLFDLNPECWFEVTLEGGRTQVRRSTDLMEIDEKHLYEPGPAKHGLHDYLRTMPPNDTVAWRPEGEPISAREMISLLQADDPLAVEFLKDIHGAAISLVRLRNRRPK